MRTTVILKDTLVAGAKKYSGEKTLSGLLNACLANWIQQQETRELEARLLREYQQGAAESRKVSRQFAAADREGWPEW